MTKVIFFHTNALLKSNLEKGVIDRGVFCTLSNIEFEIWRAKCAGGSDAGGVQAWVGC